MFIQHNQLKYLNILAEKVTHLHFSYSSVQLAFAEYQPQQCRAYLLRVSSENKVLVIVAFYLMESQCPIFFVPKCGEVPVEDSEQIYEEGCLFVESMGFVLTETDYHLLSTEKQKLFWKSLPICQPPKKNPAIKSDVVKKSAEKISQTEEDLEELRLRSLKSLGRFLAST
jgi:hypothetical protein